MWLQPLTRQEAEAEPMDPFEEHQERMKRDWVGLLGPTLLAVVMTILVNVGGYIWFMATMQSRVTNIELREKVTEDAISTLPSAYVPRAELTRNDLVASQQRAEDQHRFDRVEAKIDLILEDSQRRH